MFVMILLLPSLALTIPTKKAKKSGTTGNGERIRRIREEHEHNQMDRPGLNSPRSPSLTASQRWVTFGCARMRAAHPQTASYLLGLRTRAHSGH